MGIPKPESPEFLERCHFQVKHVKLWESAEDMVFKFISGREKSWIVDIILD